MKKRIDLVVLVLSCACILTLGVCAAGSAMGTTQSGDDFSQTPVDYHVPPEKSNVLDHEADGYCGNTVTKVKDYHGWEQSFWGSDSVAMTDLLRFLDYSGGICRCPVEYIVDTEFGENYGINLSEGFVRHDEGQTDLTQEQIELIREIIHRAEEFAF